MNKRTSALTVFTLIIALAAMNLYVSTVQGYWAFHGEVWTTDSRGNMKTRFEWGERVYIRWNADGHVRITVLYQNGQEDAKWPDLPNAGVVSFVPNHRLGRYTVRCAGNCTRVMDVWVFDVYTRLDHVVPEFMFGTVVAVGGMLASFGVFKFGVRRKGNRQQA